MSSSQESVNNEATEDDLEAREKAFFESVAKRRAEGQDWRSRQLRRMAGNRNNFYLPKKD